MLLDVDCGKVSDTFVPFCSRVFVEKEYSVEGETSFYSLKTKIIDDLRSTCAKESLVKVILKGAHDAEFLIDKDDLAARLNEYFFFAKVYDRTTLVVSEQDYALDKSVRGEFVRSVLISELTEEEKSAVIITGLNALKGEL